MGTKQRVILALAAAAATALGTDAYADMINVPGDFGTIQAAIADPGTVAGDEIVVAPGTYMETINFLGKAITLRSTDPTDPGVVAATIIDGTGNFHVVQCVSGEGPDTVLDGFTLTGANANGGVFPDAVGGGMYNGSSSPTVTNCTFSGNSATNAGGMYNNASSPTVTDCTFDGNTATNAGGGMYNAFGNPTVSNCTFSGNTATNAGGGMYNGSSSPTVTNCTFSGNSATNAGGMFNTNSSNPTVTNCSFNGNTVTLDGGGMLNTNSSSPMVTDCSFSGNSGSTGGGMYNDSSGPTVTSCSFSGNTVTSDGGGMLNTNSSGPTVTSCSFSGNTVTSDGGGMLNTNSSGPTVTDCTFSGNSGSTGGGMYNDASSPTVTNCSFSGNTVTSDGGGMLNTNSSSPTVTNCILWGNTPDQIFNNTSFPTVTYSDVQDGYAGTGNINADPLFVDADGPDDLPGTEDDDLRLLKGSHSIDAGDNSAPGLGGITTDLDGNPRFVDDPCAPDTGNGPSPIVDMGAFEDQGGVPLFGSVLRVDPAATGLNHGTSWVDAVNDVQAALGYIACSGGTVQEIWVAQGTYRPSPGTADRPATFQLLDGVALYGGFPAGGGDGTFGARDPVTFVTTLSGDLLGDDPNTSDNSFHVVTGSGTTATAVIDGFTITAGNADGSFPTDRGGGMFNSGGSPTVTHCTFCDNNAGFFGGGMYNGDFSSPTVTDCTFSGNGTQRFGAGMSNDSSNPTVTDCTFIGNTASITGGGVYNDSSSPMVTNCTFSGNVADLAGGMANRDSSPTVTNCTFSGNTVNLWGGGMLNHINSNPVVTGCTFSGNVALFDGGGIYNLSASSPTVTNCTLSGNTAGSFGGGMYNSSSSPPTVINCILWGNTAGESGDEIFNIKGMPAISFCDIQGSGGSAAWDVSLGTDGGGNIDADPLFVDEPGGDLRLSAGSPAIDAAENDAPGLAGITEDLDGNPRFVDDPCTVDTGNPLSEVIVDMGAYEFLPSCPADLNCDGVVNVLDLIDLLLCFGQPGNPPCGAADVNNDGTVNVLDLIDLLLAFGAACP